MRQEPNLTFRPARSDEAASLAALVNAAYRGELRHGGWTTESHLIQGPRTDEAEVRALMQAEDSLLLLCLQGEEVVGSVHLQKNNEASYLGMLVVRPDLQGRNLGKQLIAAAERFVQEEWGVRKMEMTVITVRTELLAFYERRGYRRTGIVKPFPTDREAEVLLVEGLEFAVLEKELG
ncbi:MAG: GNAT family N-acetyltransferase [Blastocatellia bacterium]